MRQHLDRQDEPGAQPRSSACRSATVRARGRRSAHGDDQVRFRSPGMQDGGETDPCTRAAWGRRRSRQRRGRSAETTGRRPGGGCSSRRSARSRQAAVKTTWKYSTGSRSAARAAIQSRARQVPGTSDSGDFGRNYRRCDGGRICAQRHVPAERRGAAGFDRRMHA